MACKPGHQDKTPKYMLKNTCLPLFLFLLLFQMACNPNDESVPQPQYMRADKVGNLLGRWQLVKVVAGLPVMLVETDVKKSHQFYEFYADSTFRYIAVDSSQVKGSFTFKKDFKGQEFLVLTGEPSSNFGDKFSWTDKVWLTPFNNNLLVEEYSPNDGPTFFYQKVDYQKEDR